MALPSSLPLPAVLTARMPLNPPTDYGFSLDNVSLEYFSCGQRGGSKPSRRPSNENSDKWSKIPLPPLCQIDYEPDNMEFDELWWEEIYNACCDGYSCETLSDYYQEYWTVTEWEQLWDHSVSEFSLSEMDWPLPPQSSDSTGFHFFFIVRVDTKLLACSYCYVFCCLKFHFSESTEFTGDDDHVTAPLPIDPLLTDPMPVAPLPPTESNPLPSNAASSSQASNQPDDTTALPSDDGM